MNSKLPQNWKLVKLTDCLTLINGRAYLQHELLNEGTPIIRIQNLNGGQRWYYSNLNLPENKYCEKGDLLFAWSATFGPYQWQGERGIYHYHIWKVLPKQNLDKNFAYYLLQWITESVKGKAHGISMVHMTKSGMENWEIQLPPLPEQKRIAEVLDKADALREKRRLALQKLDTLLQSVFLEMFGDPVKNPKGWGKSTLSECTEKIVDCPHSTPIWQNDGIICLRTSNLGYGEWNWDDTRYVSFDDYQQRISRSSVESGDIILSREGTVGVAAIVEANMKICMGQRLVQVRPDERKISSEYLLRLLLFELAPEKISTFMVGSTSKHINVGQLRKLPIMLPPIDMQKKFNRISLNIRRLKKNLTASFSNIENLFQSLQQRAFKGELFSNEFPAIESQDEKVWQQTSLF
ncbi:MAG: restriction endonuclease subunit S [Pyrinomonadaceae bacterium]